VACLPLLRSAASHADPARVINLGSIEGFRTQQVENYAYATSKAANHHLTRILAQRLAPEQITVNTIAPGPFPSKMMAVEFEQRQDVYEAANPMGRVGQPDDMAGIAIFLASKASCYITGQVIAVDGGFSTAPW
jgi:NAD(P)-dependent dehydrogenase (short-subunit alcohol dehydrogenase family)